MQQQETKQDKSTWRWSHWTQGFGCDAPHFWVTSCHAPPADKLPQHQGHFEVMRFVVVVSLSPVPSKWQCTQTSIFQQPAAYSTSIFQQPDCGHLKPVLNWANVCSPNILGTVRRTMIRFLIKLLVHWTWFGRFEEFTCSQLACNEMQASARPYLRQTRCRQHDRKCRLKSSQVNILSSPLTG